MPSITIQLDEGAYAQLAALAAQRTASIEELAARVVEEKLREADGARATARDHYSRYQTLFDRLQE